MTAGVALPDIRVFPPHPLMAQGWVYREIGKWVREDFWDDMLAVFGRENVEIIVETSLENHQGADWRRGQLLISPTGMERLKAHNLSAHKPVEP